MRSDLAGGNPRRVFDAIAPKPAPAPGSSSPRTAPG